MTENAVTLSSTGATPDRGLGLFESQDGRTITGLPLSGINMVASVLDAVASVEVTQTFSNSLAEPMEAVYVFPLSGASCVSACELVIGNRTIAAVVKERGEARLEYQVALEEGRTAALMEQERDNIFTLQVGNVLPGEEIRVVITYSELLTCFNDGLTELRLPLVVAPKYMSGNSLGRGACGIGTECDTNSVPDASRISPPVLASGLNPGVNLNIEVYLELPPDSDEDYDQCPYIEDLSCSQHAVRTAYKGGAVKVSLARSRELLNRDFVLSWRNAGRKITSRVYISSAAHEMEGQFFHYGLLSLRPPAAAGCRSSAPREIVFLLDRSGSMGGIKMASAARALTYLLDSLGPDDSFSICAFDDRVEWPCDRVNYQYQSTSFLKATPAGLDKGARVLRSIDSRGGTELGLALRAAYDVLKAKRHNRSADSVRRSQKISGVSRGRAQGLNLGSGADVDPPTSPRAQEATRRRFEDTGRDDCPTSASRTGLRNYPPQQIIVLITDGQVGEAGTAFKTIQDNAAQVRLFTVGIDTAVNDAFLERAAKLGGGTCALVTPGNQLESALRRIAREIGQPLITDLTIVKGDGLRLVAQAPSSVLDVFEGRPAFIFFQADEDSTGGAIVVEGKFSDGTLYREELLLELSENPALPQLFARRRVMELEDEMRLSPSQADFIRDEILALAVSHAILTRFTAFVAVDYAEKVNLSGREPRQVVQPVQAPQNWAMLQSTGSFQSAAHPIFAQRMANSQSRSSTPRTSQAWSAPECNRSFTGQDAGWGGTGGIGSIGSIGSIGGSGSAGAGGYNGPASPAPGGSWGASGTGGTSSARWDAPSPSQPPVAAPSPSSPPAQRQAPGGPPSMQESMSIRRRILSDGESAANQLSQSSLQLPEPCAQLPACPQAPSNKPLAQPMSQPMKPLQKAKQIVEQAEALLLSEDRRNELLGRILGAEKKSSAKAVAGDKMKVQKQTAPQDKSGTTGSAALELELAKMVVLLARFKQAMADISAGSAICSDDKNRLLEFIRLFRQKVARIDGDVYVSIFVEFENCCLAVIDRPLQSADPVVFESDMIADMSKQIEKTRLDLLSCIEKQDKHIQTKSSDPFWFGNV